MTPQEIQERVEDTQQWAAGLQEVHAHRSPF
jgi:hypothetical protein